MLACRTNLSTSFRLIPAVTGAPTPAYSRQSYTVVYRPEPFECHAEHPKRAHGGPATPIFLFAFFHFLLSFLSPFSLRHTSLVILHFNDTPSVFGYAVFAKDSTARLSRWCLTLKRACPFPQPLRQRQCFYAIAETASSSDTGNRAGDNAAALSPLAVSRGRLRTFVALLLHLLSGLRKKNVLGGIRTLHASRTFEVCRYLNA